MRSSGHGGGRGRPAPAPASAPASAQHGAAPGPLRPRAARAHLLAALPESVMIVAPDTGRVIHANPHALRELGWRRSDLDQRRLHETGLWGGPDAAEAFVAAAMEEGRARQALPPPRQGAEAFAAVGYRIPGPEGRPRLLVFLRAEGVPETAEGPAEDGREAVCVVTHELRTPLTSIKGALDLLRSGVAGALSPEALALVETAAGNSERMLNLIREILEMEEICAAPQAPQADAIDLARLVANAIEAHRGYGAYLGVGFADGGSEAGIMARAAPDRLAQVISNLLSNAAKASPEGGTVEIWGCGEGARAVLYIRDRGAGIPLELQTRLFDRFARSAEATPGRVAGSGLGLNIVKTLVERMEGSISFETEIGRGTTFRVDLPRA